MIAWKPAAHLHGSILLLGVMEEAVMGSKAPSLAQVPFQACVSGTGLAVIDAWRFPCLYKHG